MVASPRNGISSASSHLNGVFCVRASAAASAEMLIFLTSMCFMPTRFLASPFHLLLYISFLPTRSVHVVVDCTLVL